MPENSIFRRKSITNVLKQSEDSHGESGLNKILGVRDLTSFGIAAIIGAGIFSTIGRASFDGGPAVTMLFLFVSIACVFTALCYAQFASMVPVSGSAYTYGYVSFGEIFAWVIGWALILEYAVSNMVVAISWSEYFVSMLRGFGINFPDFLTFDYGTAHKAFLLSQTEKLVGGDISAAQAYINAPLIGGFHFLIDLPAGVITMLVTALVYVGVKESRNVSNFLVALKLVIILLVISVGAFYVKPENWTPFAPNGSKGVLKGVALVFFAFIGFDSISTMAEECKNPQRDLPRAMIYCLVICAVLYVMITFVLTGMVNYTELKVDDPLAYVFQKVGLDFVAGVISVSAVVAITSALLVYQMGQPRIWMSMSRDGLLWKRFSKIHPKFKTPSFSTIVTGFLVAIPSMFLDMGFVADLTSVGTFFAFIVVCGGVLYLDYKGLSKDAKFKIPYLNGQFLVGGLLIVALGYVISQNFLIPQISEKPLLLVFWLVWATLAVLAYLHKFSMLPVLGILTNLYLMTELGIMNWTIFLVWLAIGLMIYFGYGFMNSKLSNKVIEYSFGVIPTTLWKRLCNYVIDLISFYLLFIILLSVLEPNLLRTILVGLNKIPRLEDMLITSALFGAYMTIVEILFGGKSLGKFITKTRVVTSDGAKPTFGHFIIRGFSRIIAIERFSFLGKSNPQGWHDKWSETKVVDDITLKN